MIATQHRKLNHQSLWGAEKSMTQKFNGRWTVAFLALFSIQKFELGFKERDKSYHQL
jgi:hypothetical protein